MANKINWMTIGVVAALILGVLAITGTRIGAATSGPLPPNACEKLIGMIKTRAIEDGTVTSTEYRDTWTSKIFNVYEEKQNGVFYETRLVGANVMCTLDYKVPPS
jgi:hypothetical protein